MAKRCTETTEAQKNPFRLPSVPVKVLLMIADALPISSRIALALVSRWFFSALCPTRRFLKQKQDDLLVTLVLLERDAPDWFLCFGCTRLRPLRSSHDSRTAIQLHPGCDPVFRIVREFSNPPIPKRRPGGRRRPGTFQLWIEDISLVAWRPGTLAVRRSTPEISFSEGRLIMNRHFLGPKFGLPLQYLENVFEFDRFISLDDEKTPTTHFPLDFWRSTGYNLLPLCLSSSQAATRWIFKHQTSARIIDDELFIYRHHHIKGPPCSQVDFVKTVDSLELPVCRHILGSSRMPTLRFWVPGESCIPELLGLRVSVAESAFDIFPDNAVGSCIFCFTDYEIDIERGEIRTEWGLKLTTYHKLGDFRSPGNLVWNRLVKPLTLYLPPGSYRKSPVGGVRNEWLSGQSIPRTTGKSPGHPDLQPQPNWILSSYAMAREKYSRFDGPSSALRDLYRKAFIRCCAGQESFDRPLLVEYHGNQWGGEILST